MGITVDFSRLTFKPEVLSNCLSIVKAKPIDLLSFKNNVVSSASWHNYIPRRKSGIYWIQVRRAAAAAVEISFWTR